MPILILLFAVLTGVLLSLAFFSELADGYRAAIGFVGIVCGIITLLLLWSMLLMIDTARFQEREAVKIRQMEILQRMTDKQIEFLTQHDIRVDLHITPHGLLREYVTPHGSLSEVEVQDLTDYCLETEGLYPYLPTQHGLSGWTGSEERNTRDLIKMYTAMVVNGGLAQAASGNQPARWLVTKEEIPALLGVG